MKLYTTDELVDNYTEFLELIKKNFTGERLEKLEHMYSQEELGNRLIVAPASGKNFYHSAYPGGYMDHVTNVSKAIQGVKILFEKMGGTIDFTDEEMMFTALHHDLGKLGDEKHEYFIPEDSDWHREKLGSRFKHNPRLQFMDVPDRSLYLLQHYGIQVSQQEWLSIKLHDGPYDDAARAYLIQFNKDKCNNEDE